MRRPAPIAATAAVLALLAAAGCTTSTAAEPTVRPSTGATTAAGTVSPSETPTPTPTPSLSKAEKELAAAKQRVIDMWGVYDKVANNPKKNSINDLDPYTTGKWRRQLQKALINRRSWGYITSGKTTVEVTSGKKVSANTWSVEACVDTTAQKVVDKSGKSVTGPPYTVLHKATVKRMSWGLAIAEDEAVTEC